MKYLTPKQAAEVLGITRSAVYKRIRDKKFRRGSVVSMGGRVYIKEKSVLKILRGNENEEHRINRILRGIFPRRGRKNI